MIVNTTRYNLQFLLFHSGIVYLIEKLRGEAVETARLLGKRIRELREEAGMTQAELAEGAELSDNFIALLERGRTTPSLKTIEAIAKTLNVQISELFAFHSPLKSKLSKKDRAIQQLLRRRTPTEIETLLAIEKLVSKLTKR